MTLQRIVIWGIVIFASPVVSAKADVDVFQSTAVRCSAPEMGPLERILVESEMIAVRARRNYRLREVARQEVLRISVFMHVISKNDEPSGGYLADDVIHEQMAVLNKAFASMKIQFELQKINHVIDSKWFSMDSFSTLELKAKKALHEGDSRTLNLYSAAPKDGSLGWATFPWEFKHRPASDGVVVHYQTFPGGEMDAYNMGMTTVHEVGHWLGLLHTFQGGCGTGDEVDDTPAERAPNFGCPATVPDTCPGGGRDPIHNYMDYSDDICLDEFSPGQIQRVHDSLEVYR